MKKALPPVAVFAIVMPIGGVLGSLPLCHGQESWPGWRGANRDAISPDKGLLQSWDGAPPLAWTAENLGSGFSSVSVADGKVFTMGDRHGKQWVIALAERNGQELWAAEVGRVWNPSGYSGPRSTPTYDDGFVYVHGSHGDLVCANAQSGDVVWRKNMRRDFDGQMMSGWGYSESPLIDDNHVVVTPGGDEKFMVALDKRTGEEIGHASVNQSDLGSNGDDGAAYSSIVISHAAGVKQYVTLAGRGLVSIDANNGRLLWSYNRVANGTANIPTPVVVGDYVFGSSAYGTGSALLKIIPSGDAVRAEEIYFLNARELQNHHGGMVLVDGYLYCGHGHGQGFPRCFDVLTGEQQWKEQRGPARGSAAVAYADGKLYFRYQDGTMCLVDASPEEFNVVGKFDIPRSDKPSWPHPVIVNGRLLLREQDKLYAYDVAAR